MWNGMCTIEMIENLKIENSTKIWVRVPFRRITDDMYVLFSFFSIAFYPSP